MSTSRLFVAAWPDAAARAVLEELDRPDVTGVRWTRPEHWHVTLRFLGTGDTESAADALSSLRAEPATAVGGPRLARLGRAVLVVPVAGLDSVAGAVHLALDGHGDVGGDRPFRGHLTLARSRRVVPGRLAGRPISLSWPVTEVTLVRSDLTADGPRYTVVQRLPLGAV